MSQWVLSPDKGKGLMLVPQTTDGFRTRVSALQSLNGSKGVSFHTFSLPENCCVRLLVKNLGRQMSEGIIQEQIKTLVICTQGILQLCSGHSDQEASNVRSLTPHFILSVVQGSEVTKLHSLTELCSLVKDIHSPTRPSAERALPTLWPYAVVLQLCTPVCCFW
jgi:hypothetical protein